MVYTSEKACMVYKQLIQNQTRQLMRNAYRTIEYANEHLISPQKVPFTVFCISENDSTFEMYRYLTQWTLLVERYPHRKFIRRRTYQFPPKLSETLKPDISEESYLRHLFSVNKKKILEMLLDTELDVLHPEVLLVFINEAEEVESFLFPLFKVFRYRAMHKEEFNAKQLKVSVSINSNIIANCGPILLENLLTISRSALYLFEKCPQFSFTLKFELAISIKTFTRMTVAHYGWYMDVSDDFFINSQHFKTRQSSTEEAATPPPSPRSDLLEEEESLMAMLDNMRLGELTAASDMKEEQLKHLVRIIESIVCEEHQIDSGWQSLNGSSSDSDDELDSAGGG